MARCGVDSAHRHLGAKGTDGWGRTSGVWTSPGTSVVPRSGDDHSMRFTVRRVPATGGRVVMAAMAWPGSATDVGRVARPVDGYLLTVDLPADAAGRTVTVRYAPPGWHLELATLGLAGLGGIAWCGAFAVSRRRWRCALLAETRRRTCPSARSALVAVLGGWIPASRCSIPCATNSALGQATRHVFVRPDGRARLATAFDELRAAI